MNIEKTISVPPLHYYRCCGSWPPGRSCVSSRNRPSIIHWPINNTGIAAELFYLLIALHTIKNSFTLLQQPILISKYIHELFLTFSFIQRPSVYQLLSSSIKCYCWLCKWNNITWRTLTFGTKKFRTPSKYVFRGHRLLIQTFLYTTKGTHSYGTALNYIQSGELWYRSRYLVRTSVSQKGPNC